MASGAGSAATPASLRPGRSSTARAAGAIGWIVQAAQRLIDRRTSRVDRAAEYRALALLMDRAPALGDCHALFAACFGLYRPRHFSVPEAEPELTAPSCSWWHGAPAPVQASLYRPGSRAPGAGRTSALPDHTMARQALALRRTRERQELASALGRFTATGAPLKLERLGELDVLDFRHLLRWLARALAATADAGGVRRAESQDGLVRLALHPPPPGQGLVEITTPDGTLAAPNYQLEVSAC
jgi:uncharacterized protein (TIGR02677 family)